MIIAIDGPAGSGKSTVARRVAAQLGLQVVDTGALYRTVALAAQRAGLDVTATDRLGPFVMGLPLRLERGPAGDRHFLGDEEVTAAIRTPAASKAASAYSAVPAVRAALLELQRRLAHEPPGAVLEGRDIGTVVCPDAEHKFFLVADPAERARRRHQELLAQGLDVDFAAVLAATHERDQADEQRLTAPLRPAPDARLLDSTRLGVDEVVAQIVAVVTGAQPGDPPGSDGSTPPETL
ncbi:MAG: (d)CMP kinase [Myxococcota bacterium]|jgi:cytidylate kinase|nr:(d)CMP kinase [Myxococcota bacterium]